MKKVLSTMFVAGMFAFYACGPSAEEKAAAEKAAQDSIAAAEQAAADAAAAAASASMPADTAAAMDTTMKK